MTVARRQLVSISVLLFAGCVSAQAAGGRAGEVAGNPAAGEARAAEAAGEAEAAGTPAAGAPAAAAPETAEEADPAGDALPGGSPYLEPTELEKGRIVHLSTGVALSQEALLAYLAELPVVYVGESHDSLDDHRVQLELLKGLAARREGRLAVGLEMLPRTAQKALDDWLAGRLADEAFLQVWDEAWNLSTWPLYEPLLRFAKENDVPVVALNAERELVRAVGRQGLENVPEPLAARLPELDLEDAYHRGLVEAVFAGHAGGHGDPERFVQIQTLWDETMADTAARWLEAHPGQQLLVFAGTYHVAWGVGIPRRVFRRLPLPYAVILPWNVEDTEAARRSRMDVELPPMPMPIADVLWAVGYETRESAALGVQLEDVEGPGVRVVRVLPGSTAAEAGVTPDDVIMALDGEPIVEPFDLTRRVVEATVGGTGTLRIRRGESARDLEVTWRPIPEHGS